jgi:hypothetical protein
MDTSFSPDFFTNMQKKYSDGITLEYIFKALANISKNPPFEDAGEYPIIDNLYLKWYKNASKQDNILYFDKIIEK